MRFLLNLRALRMAALLVATGGSAYSQQPVARPSARVEHQQKALSLEASCDFVDLTSSSLLTAIRYKLFNGLIK